MKRNANASPAATSLAMSTKPRRRSATAALFAAAIALLLALPSFASADPLGSVSFFKSGLRPGSWIFNVTTGPEGNVWFVDGKEAAGTSGIGRIEPSGTITEYISGTNLSGLNAGSFLSGITVGPDEKLWMTDYGTTPAIASIDPTSPEKTVEEKEFSTGLNAGSKPQGIVTGPDGNLWFADAGTTPAIGMINPTTKAITEFSAGLNEGSQPHGIVVGSDGNLWFTDTNPANKAIGKINPTTKEITEYPTGVNTEPGGSSANYGPWGIAVGADGNVWYTENGTNEANGKAICRITPSGTITCFSSGLAATSKPIGLTAAPGGKLWFADSSGVTEKQKVKFAGTWALGDKFKLCNEAGSTCSEQEYSTTANTLRGRVKTAYNAIYGAGAVVVNPLCTGTPFTCVVTFAEEGPQVATNVGQTSCEAKTGIGTCGGETEVEGVPNAIGSITTSGEITRYPISGIYSATGITYSGGNVWFAGGFASVQQLGKFGIEAAKFPLTVTKTGSGTGTVQCDTGSGPEACAAEYEGGTEVSLTQSASPGSIFTGWGGACSGTGACEVTMSAAKEVTANFALGFTLTVNKEGTGSGTVVSSPAGIECGATCSAGFETGKEVTLTASPAPGSTFTSWKKCGTVEGRVCKVTMSEAKTVGAKFSPTKNLALSKSGPGTVSGSAICDANCASTTVALLEGKTATLTAKVAKEGSEFKEWTGACAGEGLVCVLTMSADKTTEAVFTAIEKVKLTVNKTGAGAGTVKSAPSSINCGATCSSSSSLFYKGKEVVLTASVLAGKGSALGNWSGGGCSGTAATPCTVTMSEAKTVTAEFK